MVRPLVMVSLLIPGLVQLVACCGKSPTTTSFDGDILVVDVPEDEFLAALTAEGDLDPAACEDLCRPRLESMGYTIDSVDGCDLPTTSTTSTATAAPALHSGGSTGDTGTSGVAVACSVTVVNVHQCVGGRDHACIDRRHEGHGADAFAAWLGAQAHAEATSVKSFVRVAAELRRFGAPERLVSGALEAARDEVLHARILRRLAHARGGASGELVFLPAPDRELVAFAIENAVEGCVHETWAALVAAFQAGHAPTADVRAAFTRIARDEARHSDLAWAVDAWLAGRLTAEERGRVLAARQAAVHALATASGEQDPAVREAAGLPTAAQAEALLARLDEAVWTPAAAAA